MDNSRRKCLLIAGGEYAPYKEDISFDYVIACDRGYEYAEQMGIRYDIVIGDFDSARSQPCSDIPAIVLPKEKDDTDTLFAVRHAIRKGYKDIYIICAFGGRLDHTIANLQTAAYVASQGGQCHLFGKNNELHSVKDSFIRMKRKEDSFISVFSLSDKSYGVTVTGTKYTADGLTFSSVFPLGVSNEWKDDEAVISVKSGTIAVVISKRG